MLAGCHQRGKEKIIFKHSPDCRAESLAFLLYSLPLVAISRKELGFPLNLFVFPFFAESLFRKFYSATQKFHV